MPLIEPVTDNLNRQQATCPHCGRAVDLLSIETCRDCGVDMCERCWFGWHAGVSH